VELLVVLGCLAASIGAAALLHVLVERPVTNWARGLRTRPALRRTLE
jgi:peptidoglycan/LPS O-acetylase OafA/YrhL